MPRDSSPTPASALGRASRPGSATWARLQALQLVGTEVHVGMQYGPVLSMPHQGRQRPGKWRQEIRWLLARTCAPRPPPQGQSHGQRQRGGWTLHMPGPPGFKLKYCSVFSSAFWGQINYKKLKVKFQKISSQRFIRRLPWRESEGKIHRAPCKQYIFWSLSFLHLTFQSNLQTT